MRVEPKVTEPASNSFSTELEQSNIFKQAERETEDYRKEAIIPLKWWQENCSKYPLLSHLSATSVPSERGFSTAGDIVGAQRSQMLPENVGMLILEKQT